MIIPEVFSAIQSNTEEHGSFILAPIKHTLRCQVNKRARCAVRVATCWKNKGDWLGTKPTLSEAGCLCGDFVA